MLEEANVSDGPPVEHSIMKRAWPYALALAVVVTGCYLALVPLLRSLSPAPASSATSPLAKANNLVRVGKSKVVSVVSPQHGKQTFVGLSPTTKAKTTKTTKKAKKSTTTTPAAGFATNQPSTPRTVVKTPKKSPTPPSTTTKAASKSKGAPAVGGGPVDQTQVGGGGLATGGGDSGSSDYGQTSAVGP
jgi:hypothetical protein